MELSFFNLYGLVLGTIFAFCCGFMLGYMVGRGKKLDGGRNERKA